MKNRIRTILTLSLIFAAILANAQMSKIEADNLVIDIVNDTTKNIFTYNKSIGNGVSVLTANGEELINPYNESYVYFIDDIPAANWEHPCRYCFVNKENGVYNMITQTIYPDNCESLTRIGNSSTAYRWHWPYLNYTIPPKAEPNSNLYAVLIAGDMES